MPYYLLAFKVFLVVFRGGTSVRKPIVKHHSIKKKLKENEIKYVIDINKKTQTRKN